MKSKNLRSYLFAGLVIWLPIVVTFIILRFLVDMLDSTFALLPNSYQPEKLLGIHIPGLGVLLSLLLLLITGLVARNILGQRLLAWGDSMLIRIPLVRTIYQGTKQVIEAIFASNGQAFRKVMLIEYPRKGIWSLAFLTGSATADLALHSGEQMVSLFIPTTPNPTSGFLIWVPVRDVIELNMSVEDALKLIISLGAMMPTETTSVNY